MSEDIIVELPDRLRSELKEPFGPVVTEASEILETDPDPLITVGDIVTHHLLAAGRTPDVALVDERTERAAVGDEIAASIANADGFDRELTVSNPAATLTAELLAAMADAIESDDATLLTVDGEEDLAALPAMVFAPSEGSVVYGQPGEGMVHIVVDEALKAEITSLLVRMDGDTERLRDLLE